MKKYISKLCMLFITAICLSFLLDSCNDTWDNHFMQDESGSSEPLLEKIKASSDLSTFVSLLEKVGYDEVLKYPQAYTVFAPVNAAFAKIPPEILNDDNLLKALLANHVCRFSYSSVDAKDNLRLKMMNGKYENFKSSGGQLTFSESALVGVDDLCANGILHKINDVILTKPNIWDYLNQSKKFPSIINYLAPYNTMVFDEANSVPIGKNTLGQTIYDSVFVASNSYFDIIGNLNSEEVRYTFLGLPDVTFAKAYKAIEGYFKHPDIATASGNVNKTIVDNLVVVPEIAKNELTGGYLKTTTGNDVKVDAVSVLEDVKLSNGHTFTMSDFNLEPKIWYKPVRFEVEDTNGRTIGKTSDFTIEPIYDISSSGNFKNRVTLKIKPSATNEYFEVSFGEVCSANYDIYIKFSPVGASKSSKLKYILTYSKMDGSTTTVNIAGGIVGNDIDDRVKIGDTYNFPVYTNRLVDTKYFVKLKVIVDVSDAELILYDRTFGIDYIELVPVQ